VPKITKLFKFVNVMPRILVASFFPGHGVVSHGSYVTSLSWVLRHLSSHYCQHVNCRTSDIGHRTRQLILYAVQCCYVEDCVCPILLPYTIHRLRYSYTTVYCELHERNTRVYPQYN